MVVGFDSCGIGVDDVGDGVVVHVVVVSQVEGELLLWRQGENSPLQRDGFGIGIVAIFIGKKVVNGRILIEGDDEGFIVLT